MRLSPRRDGGLSKWRAIMRQQLKAALGGAALLLGACSGGHDSGDDGKVFQPPAGPVRLFTVDDAARELGNVSTGTIISSLGNGTAVSARAVTRQRGLAVLRVPSALSPRLQA